ncbi:hypothetical protein [Actinomadura macrotermitis]|uniref:Immunity protein 35 domain-containing protein n=1 Tax=Actinomadura macrotermitis TaxID=2585200 RepID=A0A7K0BZ00_9ACTN|nr:hypothetical protein [Actinomadura macrotermitis]MQY06415.1 hypothetical protein [Actinomadura macrotermitis]
MITREQVVERSRAMFDNAPSARGRRFDVGVHEFDLGFVVWPVEPPPADWSRPPSTIGGSVLVIDRQTGRSSVWPRLAAPQVAELYRRSLSS